MRGWRCLIRKLRTRLVLSVDLAAIMLTHLLIVSHCLAAFEQT